MTWRHVSVEPKRTVGIRFKYLSKARTVVGPTGADPTSIVTSGWTAWGRASHTR